MTELLRDARGFVVPQYYDKSEGVYLPLSPINNINISVSTTYLLLDTNGFPITNQYLGENGEWISFQKSNPFETISPYPSGPSKGISDVEDNIPAIVEVGKGLILNNGVLSVDNFGINFIDLPIDALPAEYPMGVYYTNITSSEVNIKVRDIVASVFGASPDTLFLRHEFKTFKSNILPRQTIDVYLSGNKDADVQIFKLTRAKSGSGWSNWSGNVIEMVSEGNPQGVKTGVYGCKCLDSTTGNTYIKKSANKTEISKNGWVLVP